MIFALLVSVSVSSFADEMDMDGRMIPNFSISIPKADTNFSISRQESIKKITLNESKITTRDLVAQAAPTYKMSTTNIITGEVKTYGME